MTALVQHDSVWTPLRDTLQQLARQAGGALKYVPNQGNAGDALIAAATWQFFDDCGITPICVATAMVAAGDTVVYAGGGNLVPEYNNCRLFLEQCLRAGVRRALVMPQSIRGNEDVLSRLDGRFTLVCRDAASLDRVQSSCVGVETMYAPDMALYLDVQRLFERCAAYQGVGLWAKFMRNRKLWCYYRWRRALNRLCAQHGGRIDVIRTDAEAVTAYPGNPRWDLPGLYGSKYRFREESDLVSRDLLSFFKQVKGVRTNRLHVGVAGALMDCEVTYLDNSYGKIRAVYDAWLHHLPSIRFEQPA